MQKAMNCAAKPTSRLRPRQRLHRLLVPNPCEPTEFGLHGGRTAPRFEAADDAKETGQMAAMRGNRIHRLISDQPAGR